MTTKGKDFLTRMQCAFNGKEGQVVLAQLRTEDKSVIVQELGIIDQQKHIEVLSIHAIMFAP